MKEGFNFFSLLPTNVKTHSLLQMAKQKNRLRLC